MATIALHALFFWFTGWILLNLVCVSSPKVESISFLNAGTGADRIHFGAFGYTGSNTSVGYDFPAVFAGLNGGKLSSNTINNLTSALIIHPIAAGLAGLAFLCGLFEILPHYSGPALGYFFSSLAFLLTLIVFIIDMVLWGTVKNILRDNGISAGYGNANWLTLGAFIALSADSVSCGISCCCISCSYDTTVRYHASTFHDFQSFNGVVYY